MNINHIFFAFLLSFSLLHMNCQGSQENANEMVLDERYEGIKEIFASAQCDFPDGKYISETFSVKGGEVRVFQQKEDKKPFRLFIQQDNTGILLDDNQSPKDTLPAKAVEMFRYHEFHRIHTDPGYVYSEITFDKAEGDHLLFTAVDRLKNPATIFYNKKEKAITKLEFIHPMDNKTPMEIVHHDWTDSDYGKMVKSLSVVQAKKDSFHFNFQTININP